MVETVDGPAVVVIEKKRYEELLEQEKWLRALEAAGVDNWNGYDFAQDLREEAKM